MEVLFRDLKMKLTTRSEREGGPGDCLIWRGATDRHGYGVMWVRWPEEGKKLERVHRVALMVQMHLTRSQFPGGGLEVNHVCQSSAPGRRGPCHQPGEGSLQQPGVLL